MEVVTIVAVRIIAGQMRTREVVFINLRRLGISDRRFVILPDAGINMRRHMDKVASTWHQAGQTVCASQRALRLP